MLKGFAAGSLTLIVLWVFVQRGTSDKLTGASSLIVGGLRRFMSGDVAGVPSKATAKTNTVQPPADPNADNRIRGPLGTPLITAPAWVGLA